MNGGFIPLPGWTGDAPPSELKRRVSIGGHTIKRNAFPRFIAQHGNPGAPLMRMSVAGCYSLRITLKRPLFTVNAPLPA